MISMKHFSCSRVPQLFFGKGSLACLNQVLAEQNIKRALVITGQHWLKKTEYWNTIVSQLGARNFFDIQIEEEPSPHVIDTITSQFTSFETDVVIAVGGGSVIDTGKAVAALLCMEGSVEDYLEGVGSKKPTGSKKKFIAIPTTSGTGAEATKNAVISKIYEDGIKGFKKSLRHDNYVPDIALIDPELTLTLPPKITAESGLDAITQLLESYVSSNANPFTDTLAIDGLRHAGRSFPWAVEEGSDILARTGMAYAAYISGLTLANAGLGVVHGAASVLGGMRKIPHGAACGSLIGEAVQIVIRRLSMESGWESKYLKKYAEAGMALCGKDRGSTEENCNGLIHKLTTWISQYAVPRLSAYGFTKEDIIQAAEMTSQKNTPVKLKKDDIRTIFMARL